MGAISPFPTVETCLTWIKACVSNRKITQICLYFLLFSFIENGFLSHIIYPDYRFPFLYSYQFFHIFFPNRTTPFLCLIRKKNKPQKHPHIGFNCPDTLELQKYSLSWCEVNLYSFSSHGLFSLTPVSTIMPLKFPCQSRLECIKSKNTCTIAIFTIFSAQIICSSSQLKRLCYFNKEDNK